MRTHPYNIAQEILAERERQVDEEGWTPEHDDQHTDGGLVHAAVCYAMGERIIVGRDENGRPIAEANMWPWDVGWWKPKDRRRNLVKAASLLVAEIERLDRAEGRQMLRDVAAAREGSDHA